MQLKPSFLRELANTQGMWHHLQQQAGFMQLSVKRTKMLIRIGKDRTSIAM